MARPHSKKTKKNILRPAIFQAPKKKYKLYVTTKIWQKKSFKVYLTNGQKDTKENQKHPTITSHCLWSKLHVAPLLRPKLALGAFRASSLGVLKIAKNGPKNGPLLFSCYFLGTQKKGTNFICPLKYGKNKNKSIPFRASSSCSFWGCLFVAIFGSFLIETWSQK